MFPNQNYQNYQNSNSQNYNGYQNYNEQQLIQQQNQYFQKLNQVLDNHKDVKKTYQNVNYHFDRIDRKTLVIDVVIGGSSVDFNVDLIEPLIIDKQSDVFLEHFTTTAAKKNDSANETAYIFKIDQFNIHNSTNKTELQNALIIPNEHTSTDNELIAKIHKGKKLNYICNINPTKLSKISGSITALDGSSVMFGTDGRFIAEFIIVPRKE